jgi:mono/diheme cytochrome c family protein
MKTAAMLFCALILLSSCGSGDGEAEKNTGNETTVSLEQKAERGQQIFRDRSFGSIEIACVDCHADFDETLARDDRIRPGHSILGAHQRVESWNGEFSGDGQRRTAAGAAKCAWLYQEKGSGVEDALSEEEAEALMAYYAYISPGDEPPKLSWSAVTWPGDPDFSDEAFERDIASIDDLRGNPVHGKEMFDRACAPCHDTGLGPATRILKRKVEMLPATVRGGEETMPFFSRDRLTDQDIADIKSFVAQ